MADSVTEKVIQSAAALANATSSSLGSVTAANTPASWMVPAYLMLIGMASLCVYVGCFYSLREKSEEDQNEVMTTTDAYMFPLYASGFLLGLYIIFKIFGKEYINLLVSAYFFILGVMAVATVLAPLLRPHLSQLWPADTFPVFHLAFTRTAQHPSKPTANKDKTTALDTSDAPTDAKHKEEAVTQAPDAVENLFDLTFDYSHVAAHVVGCLLGAWYLYEKHWIVNNIFGMCFAISGIELLALGTYQVGCILLGGLFAYDIFWVFGTDVMVTVAKSFEAPIKLLFPKDLALNLYSSKSFAMLGLGDIVIPGILLALLLRFDRSRQKDSTGTSFAKPYFHGGFVAYVAGLLLTFVVMHTFKAAQPALLYLVPACLLTSSITALVRGEFGLLLAYNDSPPEAETKKKD